MAGAAAGSSLFLKSVVPVTENRVVAEMGPEAGWQGLRQD